MDILSKFGERLSEFIKENNFTIESFSKIVNSNTATISECMRGQHYPDLRVFIAICEYFNCPADYMLGLSDDFPENARFNAVPQFGQRFRYVLKFCGQTQYSIEKKMPLSGSNVYKWLNGQSSPSVESLIRLSRFLGVSVDFLLGRTD